MARRADNSRDNRHWALQLSVDSNLAPMRTRRVIGLAIVQVPIGRELRGDECFAQRQAHRVMNFPFAGEADFAFGRMHIDIDRIGRQIDENDGERMATVAVN